jgi:hypothetical protein
MTLSPSDLDRVEALAKKAMASDYVRIDADGNSQPIESPIAARDFYRAASPAFLLSLIAYVRELEAKQDLAFADGQIAGLKQAENQDVAKLMMERDEISTDRAFQKALNLIAKRDLEDLRSQLSLAHARIGELEKALKPFARVGQLIKQFRSQGKEDFSISYNEPGSWEEHYRQAYSVSARAALASPDQKEESARA